MPQPWTPPPNTTCPKCGQAMIVRGGRFGLFTGCSGYPACDMIVNRFGFSDQPTRNARKAAHAAFDGVAPGRELVADRYEADFDALYRRLAMFPESGSLRPELGRFIRIGLVSPYVVV